MKKTIVIRLVNSYIEKNKLFVIILHNGNQSQPLRFFEEDSECLIAESVSDGVLAAYNYDDIANLLPVTSNSQLPIDMSNNLLSIQNTFANETLNSEISSYWAQEYEKAVEQINFENFSLINRRNEIKTKVRHTEIAKEWGRIDSMFNDAKKNHVLDQKAERIIAELDSLPQYTEVKINLGMVYAELKNYAKAAEEFYNGGDYHNAAYCAFQNGNEKNALYYLKCMIKSSDTYDKSALAALFSLACKYKDTSFCADNFNSPDSLIAETVFYGLLILYKRYDDIFSNLGKPSGEYLSDISLIIGRLPDSSSENNDANIKLSSFISVSKFDVKTNEFSIEETKEVKGKIYSFYKFDNNGYGYITVKDDEKLYYNIRQVEDEQLRTLLWNGCLTEAKVSLTFGIGMNGMKAADHIKSAEDFSAVNTVYEGILDSYKNYDKQGNRYGIISYNDNDVRFKDEAIIDPVLKAYIDNVFAVKNISIKFVGKKAKNNHIALKVWLDNDEEKELFKQYFSYVSKEEYNEFIKKKDEIENGILTPCIYGYSQLPIWRDDYDDVKTGQAVDKETNKNEYNILSNTEKEYQEFWGINELLTNGTHYLTKDKNLPKAESCFLEVLKRKPDPIQINTAVSNLVMIYKQENRTDDALIILDKHHNSIENDKYNNHLIDIYCKTKQYDDLIVLLKDTIPDAGKAKTHRIKQLIDCYLKTNNAKEAMIALKRYKNSIDELSYNNLYFSALELLDDYSESVTFLKNIIENTYRVDYKLNFMNKLAFFIKRTAKGMRQ